MPHPYCWRILVTRGHRTLNIFWTNMRTASNKRIFEHLKFTKLANIWTYAYLNISEHPNIRIFKHLIICENSRIDYLTVQKIANMNVRCLVVPVGDKKSRRILVIMMSTTSLWSRVGFKMSPTSFRLQHPSPILMKRHRTVIIELLFHNLV